MRQLTFFDLPIEIIDYIIECLPYYIVLELQNFSVSRPYVLQILYKKVEINSFSPPLIQSTIKFPDRNDLVIKHIPTRMTFDELDLAIKDNKLSWTREISFDSPKTLFRANELYPSLLEKVEIKIDFGIFNWVEDPEKPNFYKWGTYPVLKISSLESVNYQTFYLTQKTLEQMNSTPDHAINQSILKGVMEQGEFLRDLVNFKHLVDFHILNIYGSLVGMLPKSIKNLKIDTLTTIEPGHPVVKFPKGLVSLAVLVLDRDTTQSFDPIDLSDLEHLKSLTCDFSRSYKLPRNLLSIRGSGTVSIPQVISQCPLLKSIDSINLDKGYDDEFYELNDELENLKMKCDDLYCLLKIDSDSLSVQSHENSKVIKFPKMLKSLQVSQRYHMRDELSYQVFSSLKDLQLDYLTDLSLSCSLTGDQISPLPRNLKTLYINEIEQFHYNELKSLSQLKSLHILDDSHDYFDYDLPDTLFEFEYENINCELFKMRAKNLQYFKICEAPFQVLNRENFVLPDSIINLRIVNSDVEEIEASFKFPLKLRELDLSINRLTSLPQLPSSLRWLSCEDNGLGEMYKPINFPLDLEVLNLNKNDFIHRFDVSSLNLSNCTKLRKLSITGHKSYFEMLHKLKLSNFPKSLISLDLEDCGVLKFIGDFTYFPNLEELNIAGNPGIEDVFLGKGNPSHYSYFPDSIKRVWLTKDYLDPEMLSAIVNDAKKKPNFEFVLLSFVDDYIRQLGERNGSYREGFYDEDMDDSEDEDNMELNDNDNDNDIDIDSDPDAYAHSYDEDDSDMDNNEEDTHIRTTTPLFKLITRHNNESV